MEERPKENDNGCTCAKKNQNHKLFCELLLDFAKNTTLHGLGYVTERGLSLVEKIFWMITFLISLSVCLWLIGNVWVKWQTSPMIVTLSEELTSVTEVPFPAVTICPQAKIKQNKYNYTDNLIKFYTLMWGAGARWDNESRAILNITQSPPSEILHNLGLICQDRHVDILDNRQKTDHSAVEDIIKIAPQLDDIFAGLGSWRNKRFPTEELFDIVLTNEGMCFTFNSLSADEIFDMESIQRNYSYLNASAPRMHWSMEIGYSSSGNNTYPRRGRANSAEADLSLTLIEVLDRDILCDGFNRGYKVYLHHPADLPQSSLFHYTVPPGQIASFAIKVNVMKTSETLIQYSSQIRQCYFPLEKKLRYFRVYTLNNCLLECSTNYTLAFCDCVWFHMPYNDSTALCDYQMYDCVVEALEYAVDDATNSSPCKCLPACDSVQYEAEVIKNEYNAQAFNKITKALWIKVLDNILGPDEKRILGLKSVKSPYSKIEMYFKESRFVSMRRSELFGLTDFLANCGGLLGLFLGFSFLSLIEIFYFFTLRFTCKLRRNKIAETNKKVDHLKIV